jgi:cell division transport system permease protein
MRADVVVREVATGLRRNLTMTVAMLLTTAISLGLVGTGLLAVRIIDRTEELYSARVEIQVALTSDLSARDTDCSQPACAALYQRLSSVPGVQAVRFVNQQQAYERYKELFAGQALADLAEPGTLPASLRVKLREDLQGPAGAAAVRAAVDGQVGVRTVVDQRETVGTLFDFLAGVRNVTFALALTQAVAAVLLISNAVQVSAFTRRTEVGVMRLVGATRWFTQLPFLVEAVVTGVAGALLASAALVAAKILLVDDLLAGNVGTSVVPPVQLADVLWVSPILVLLGGGVAALTGYATLRLYVRL